MALEGEFEECSTFVKVWTNGRKASTAEKLDSYKFFKQVRPRARQNNTQMQLPMALSGRPSCPATLRFVTHTST